MKNKVVSIEEFCSSSEFLDIKLYPKQLEVLKEFYNPTKNYNELVLLLGKGSGKDFMASIIVAYSVYWLQMLPDPQGFLGLAPSDGIDIVNVATTDDQASTIFFSRLKARLDCSEYFKSLSPVTYSDRIFFPKNVNSFSMNSRNESYEGKNVFTGILDEASAFRFSANYGSAASVYKTLFTSMISRFPIHGKIATLSYPRTTTDDFTIDLYNSKKDSPRTLVVKGKVWEFNMNVSRESLQSFYDYDSSAAKLMFECDLKVSLGEYFLPEQLENSKRDVIPIIKTRKIISTKLGRNYVSKEVLDVKRTKEHYMIGIDTGIRGSSMALSIGHLSDNMMKVDQVLKWIPENGLELDFDSVFELLLEFSRNNQLDGVYLDQFNAAYLEQRLLEEGIDAKKVNFTKRAMFYETLNMSLRMNKLELPSDAIIELKEIVMHKPGSFKNITDVADSVALLSYALMADSKKKSASSKKSLSKPKIRIAS